MDVWDDLIGDLWPEDKDGDDNSLPYLRNRLDENNMRKAISLRLSSDLGAECAASLQTDWDWYYRFTYSLLAAFAFAPADPAQWFVDLGLNRYREKAIDVLNNIAIAERRQAAMAMLLPKRPAPETGIESLAREWIFVQAHPEWELARWTMQIAVGLIESKNYSKGYSLIQRLPEASLQLAYRYVAALAQLLVAARQAVTEAMERPDLSTAD